MKSVPVTDTPVHRFTSADDFKFRFVTITEKSFEIPDVEHRHNYWTVFVFLNGEGRHVIDFREVPVTPGSIHVVLPGQIHALHGGDKFLAHALIFTEDFFLQHTETIHLLMRLFCYMDSGQAVAFDIPDNDRSYFQSLLQLIRHEYESHHPLRGTVLYNLLTVFVSKYMGSLPLPVPVHETDKVMRYVRFRHAIEKNFKQVHTVGAFSTMLHESSRQLNDLCRLFTGNTALDFIHERLLTEAKRLLKFSDQPVKQVAYELHFTDAAHFTNFFKQKTGYTPLEFKQR